MKNEIIIKVILWLFKLVIPRRYKWHKVEIKKFIDYQIERNNDTTYWFVQPYDEDIRMIFCKDLAEHIKIDLICKKDNPYAGMHLQHREPKDEYDKGVLSCLGLIYHTQHCMNPS